MRGALSVWFYHSLRTEGLPAICIDARHAKAALDMAANKTDLQRSCFRCWKPGAVFTSAPPNSDASWSGTRQNQVCRILMSIPGIGAITATAFTTAIERPDNFKKSRSVGAWIGLATRRYQSGEVDYDGHIPTWRPPFARALFVCYRFPTRN
jgi:transposase